MPIVEWLIIVSEITGESKSFFEFFIPSSLQEINQNFRIMARPWLSLSAPSSLTDETCGTTLLSTMRYEKSARTDSLKWVVRYATT